jgi:hypothetical protein
LAVKHESSSLPERTTYLEGEKLIEALRHYFAGQEDVVAAYLFGSQATAKARP